MKKPYQSFTITAILLFFACSFFCTPVKGQPGFFWHQLGAGAGGKIPYVKALATCDTNYNPFIFAGGNFTTVGGVTANRIAKWNDNANMWDSLGSGTNGEVDALVMYNSKLYAGGMFDSAGGIYTSHIACWDTAWDSLQGGLNGNVYALCVYNGALYAGGDFTLANGIKVNRIAKWDGTTWDSVGIGFDSNTVYALATYDDTLYAGGSFTKSGGNTVNYIAKWNGTKWIALGGGVNDVVYSLDSCRPDLANPALFAGGTFTKATGINANHIASWTPTSGWDSLGPGTDDTVRALGNGYGQYGESAPKNKTIDIGHFLLVGGNFTNQGNVYSPYVAFWDGHSWDSAGYVNKPVYAVTVDRFNYIGGEFDSNYCYSNYSYCNTLNPTNNIAKLLVWLGGGINEISDKSDISIYPNPSNGVFTVAVIPIAIGSDKLTVKSVVEIYNTLGKKVYSVTFPIVNYPLSIDLHNESAGLYLCRVIDDTGKLIGSEKIIIQ